MKSGSWASFQAAAEPPDREEEELESQLSSYPTTTERLITRAEIERLRAIIAALAADGAVYHYADALRVCRYCGNTAEEGHASGCPVGAALAL